MSEPTGADAYGAVDLSAMAPAAATPEAAPGAPVEAGPQAVISVPLIMDVTEANFEEQMALSQTVPVVLAFYSARALSSQQAITVLEDTTRANAGAFELGKIDVDTQPGLMQALQIQTLPTAIALVAGRPVPLFEGVPTADQLNSLITELLQVAPQLQVTGRIQVVEEDLERPLPPAHEAPRAAEDIEDWATAIQLWKKVLANSPADSEAKLALARAEFEGRQVAQDSTSVLADADNLFAAGREAEAFALLLEAFGTATDADDKEAARARLVELFKIASDTDAVKQARTKLATQLMI